MSNDWEIKIDDITDARRFCRLGGYAGFTYALVAVLVLFIGILLNQTDFVNLSKIDQISHLTAGLIHFVFFWFLAWRVHSGNGKFSSVVMLSLFILFKILNLMALQVSVLGVLYSGAIAYAMYAGILGSWYVAKYKNRPDPKVFD